MEFENLQHLKETWIKQEFDYPTNITISGVEYERYPITKNIFENLITGKTSASIVYATSVENKQLAEEAGLNRWVVFNWKKEDLSLIPHNVVSIPSEHFIRESSQERIGDVVILKVMLPSGAGALKGKVDTGADVCSMHAENIRVVGDVVKFISPELSQNELSLPVAQYHAVKSADGGTSNRPVVELDIEINGKPIRRIQFNLNDRSQMEYPVLIGQNALEKTNFLIDPNDDGHAKENFEWVEGEFITEDIIKAEFDNASTIIAESAPVDTAKMEAIYSVLENSDITLQDLVKYIRAEARTVLEDVDY